MKMCFITVTRKAAHELSLDSKCQLHGLSQLLSCFCRFFTATEKQQQQNWDKGDIRKTLPCNI